MASTTSPVRSSSVTGNTTNENELDVIDDDNTLVIEQQRAKEVMTSAKASTTAKSSRTGSSIVPTTFSQSYNTSSTFPPLPLVLRVRREKRRQQQGVSSSINNSSSIASSILVNGGGGGGSAVSSNATTTMTNTVPGSNSSSTTTVPTTFFNNVHSSNNAGTTACSGSSTIISLDHIKELIDCGPVEILKLAVQYDESRTNGENLLKTPLETGRLFGDPYQFVHALEYLYKQTTTTATTASMQLFIGSQSPPWTPIVALPGNGSIQSSQQAQQITTMSSLASSVSVPGTTGGSQLYSNSSSSPARPSTNKSSTNVGMNNISTTVATGTTSSSRKSMSQSPPIQSTTIRTNQNPTRFSLFRTIFFRNEQPASYHALTPIVLSGLISALKEQRAFEEQQQQQQQHHDNNSTSKINSANSPIMNDYDYSSQLVSICQNMRQAAINRIRIRKKRQQIQRIVLPITTLSILFVLYLRTMSDMRSVLIQLGYVRSCDGMPAYAPACRLAEVTLWHKYRDYLLYVRGMHQTCINQQQQQQQQVMQQSIIDNNSSNKQSSSSSSGWNPLNLDQYRKKIQCNKDHTLLQNRYREAPFTLHTTLVQDLITFDELTTGKYRPTFGEHKSMKRRNKKRQSQSNSSSTPSLRWLGDSTVNRLVRTAIEEYLPPRMPWNIFDAGCGVGGTLYALLPEVYTDMPSKTKTTTTTTTSKNFTYHGVAASGAEVAFARSLVRFHNVDKLFGPDSIFFEQRSFEERLKPNSYTIAVAIESLSFSRNVDNTVTNLVKALKPGGILIMMDDVVYPTLKVATDEYTVRPSLFSHTSWKQTLENAGCTLKVARDLSLEYDLLHDSIRNSNRVTSSNGGTVYENHARYDSSGSGSRMDVRDSNDSTSSFLGVVSSWLFGNGIHGGVGGGGGDSWFSFIFDSTSFLERWLAHTGNVASQRLIELHDEKVLLEKLLLRRKEAYKQTILSYNFYVCIKTTS